MLHRSLLESSTTGQKSHNDEKFGSRERSRRANSYNTDESPPARKASRSLSRLRANHRQRMQMKYRSGSPQPGVQSNSVHLVRGRRRNVSISRSLRSMFKKNRAGENNDTGADVSPAENEDGSCESFSADANNNLGIPVKNSNVHSTRNPSFSADMSNPPEIHFRPTNPISHSRHLSSSEKALRVLGIGAPPPTPTGVDI